MKYVAAVIASIVVLLLFAFFAAAIGWRHGGGIMVQSFLWAILAVVWVTITKNWDAILARLKNGGNSGNQPPILATGHSQIIIAGVILILIAAMFATIVSKLGSPSAIEIAQEAAKIIENEQEATKKQEVVQNRAYAPDYSYHPWDRPKNPTEKEWLILELIASFGDSQDIEADGFSYYFTEDINGTVKCIVWYTLNCSEAKRRLGVGLLRKNFEYYKKLYPWAELEIEEKFLKTW
jgi:hypothetical protein